MHATPAPIITLSNTRIANHIGIAQAREIAARLALLYLLAAYHALQLLRQAWATLTLPRTALYRCCRHLPHRCRTPANLRLGGAIPPQLFLCCAAAILAAPPPSWRIALPALHGRGAARKANKSAWRTSLGGRPGLPNRAPMPAAGAGRRKNRKTRQNDGRALLKLARIRTLALCGGQTQGHLTCLKHCIKTPGAPRLSPSGD